MLSVARSSCESGTPPDKRLHEQTSGELKLHCVGSFIRRCDASVAAIEVVLSAEDIQRISDAAPPGAAAGTRYPEPMMAGVHV